MRQTLARLIPTFDDAGTVVKKIIITDSEAKRLCRIAA